MKTIDWVNGVCRLVDIVWWKVFGDKKKGRFVDESSYAYQARVSRAYAQVCGDVASKNEQIAELLHEIRVLKCGVAINKNALQDYMGESASEL